jgi:Ala-tRNA(Pro) deacylase
MKTKNLLDEKRIDYKVYPHEETTDAQHLAAALRVPGGNVLKTVLLRANGGYHYFVAVLPATERLNLRRVSESLGGADIHLATETEIADRCPDCEFGILPPFGSRFGMQTIVDESVLRLEDIFFQGDTHREAIRMKYGDYSRLEHPCVMALTFEKSPATEAKEVVEELGVVD